MFRGQFLRSTQPISGVIALSRTACSLLVLRQIETHVASKAFLPTTPFLSFFTHQFNVIAFFFLSFCSTFFMLCFQNSQPFLGLSFRLVYIMCLYVYYSQISNCLQLRIQFFWLYLMLNYVLILLLSFLYFNQQISFITCFYVVKQKFSLVTRRVLDLLPSARVFWYSNYS